MEEKIGFIGGGRMAEALIQGICASGLALPENIFVADPVQSRRDFLKSECKVEVTDQATSVAEQCNFIIWKSSRNDAK